MLTAALAALLTGGCGGDGGTTPSGPAIASILLSDTDFLVGLGATRRITAVAVDGNVRSLTDSTGFNWTSSNASLASVNSHGDVLGVALGGPVTITVSKAGKSATATVTVAPAAISISPPVGSLAPGQSVQLSATAHDFAGAAVSAGLTAWSTSDTAVATVTPSGLFTTVAPGMVTVYATIARAMGNAVVGVSSVYDGGWSGTNSYGRTILFTVTYGSVREFHMPGIPVVMGCTTDLNATVNAPIVNARFSFSTNNALVSGAFSSPTTMTGSHGNLFFNAVPCASGPYNIGIGMSNITATRQ